MTEGAKRGRTKDGKERGLEQPKSARGVVLEPLLATPERRRGPSWLSGTYLSQKAHQILTSLSCMRMGNPSGSATETEQRKHQLPCMEILQVLKTWCRNDRVLVVLGSKSRSNNFPQSCASNPLLSSPSKTGHVPIDSDFSRWQLRIPQNSGVEREGG